MMSTILRQLIKEANNGNGVVIRVITGGGGDEWCSGKTDGREARGRRVEPHS